MFALFPWGRLLAVLALCVGLMGLGAAGMHKLDKVQVAALQADFDSFKAAVATEAAKQAQHTQTIIQAQEAANAKISGNYAAALAALRQRVPERTRPDGSALPELSCGPAGVARASPDPVPVAAVSQADYDELAKRAAETTLMVLGWQAWYREQAAAWR